MTYLVSRRSVLRGLFAAPAIIAIDRLMPVRALAAIAPRAPATLLVGDWGAEWRSAGQFLYASIAGAAINSVPGDSIVVAPGHVETVGSEGLFVPSGRAFACDRLKIRFTDLTLER